MTIAQMIADLRSQRDMLDEAILTLERLALSGPKRRGRPPGRVTGAGAAKFVHNGVNGTSLRPGKEFVAGSS